MIGTKKQRRLGAVLIVVCFAFMGAAVGPAYAVIKWLEGEPGEWRVRGMAALPQARGRGAGTAVLGALLDHARADGASAAWCTARTSAQRLYERMGFKVVSDEFEVPDAGPYVVMRMALARDHHQASCSSVTP